MPLTNLDELGHRSHTHEGAIAFFIDEQRFGPYAFWHHQHHFKEVIGGVEMTDEVNYAIPLGVLGAGLTRRLATLLFGREVNRIFDFRFKALEKIPRLANKNNEQLDDFLLCFDCRGYFFVLGVGGLGIA